MGPFIVVLAHYYARSEGVGSRRNLSRISWLASARHSPLPGTSLSGKEPAWLKLTTK